MERTVLISLKPRYARAILEGLKRIELRRFRVRFGPGDRILIYASSPVRRVIGAFTVGRVEIGAPAEVWERIGKEASGLSPSGFFSYLSDASRCSAIEVVKPVAIDPPLELSFSPPQSYFFLHPDRAGHRELLRLLRTI